MVSNLPPVPKFLKLPLPAHQKDIEVQINPTSSAMIEEHTADGRVIKYIRGEQLGKGAFATCVKLTRVSEDKKVFACKIISKETLQAQNRKEKLEQEVTIQMSLTHPNIVRLEHFFEDAAHIYLLLELCPHQSMHDLLHRRGFLSEIECRYFLR